MTKVALIGRPNVGKSTLFNRLTGRKKAIVHDLAGVTRDRKYSPASIGGLNFTIIDTPGFEDAKTGTIQEVMMQQTIAAIEEADVILMIVDGIAGFVPSDHDFARVIRRYDKPTILIVNKAENARKVDNSFYKIGFGDPVFISAEHGTGLADFYQAIAPHIQDEDEPEKIESIKLAIVGRPNVGKSTYINALLGEPRLLTSPIAGSTRDAIEIEWEYDNQPFTLIDTAGLRKKANITKSLEKITATDSLTALKFANVVVIMLDGTEPLTHQDISLAALAAQEGRCVIIAVNKVDIVEKMAELREEINYQVENNYPDIKGAPVCFISAKKGKNLLSVLDEAIKVYNKWNKKVSTGKLNKWLEDAKNYHQPPLNSRGKPASIKYAAQIGTRPPTIKLFCSKASDIPEGYRRYLLNDFRQTFDFEGVPVRMRFVSNKNPYTMSEK